MNKLVVLIDSGLMKYSTRFVARSRLNIANDAPIKELAEHPAIQGTIYDTLATSLRSKLSNIETNVSKIDRCIVCLDIGDSWRTKVKKTLIPGTEQASSIDYKGHRRTDDPEELAAIVKLNANYNKALHCICDNSGIECVGKPGIEADDFMCILGLAYARQGDKVIIISSDADITQAVASFDNGGFVIIMQHKHTGIINTVVDKGLHDKIANIGIFNMQAMSNGLINMIQNAQVVAPQYVLLSKILNGDSSDDISPVMSKTIHNRTYKLKSNDLTKIFAYFEQHNSEGYFKIDNIYNDNDIDIILSMMHMSIHKQDFHSLDTVWQQFYYNKFIENRQMVCINELELGEHYVTAMSAANEQLHGHVPIIAFPSWQVLQQLNL